MKNQGLIIPVPMVIGRGGNTSIPDQDDVLKQTIIKGMLFWDEIQVPSTSAIYVGIEDEALLLDAGIISRPILSTPGSREIPNVHFEYLEFLRSKESELWSMDNTLEFPVAPDCVSDEHRAVLINLYDALPIPSINVSYDDLLALKRKRYDELLALRNCLNDCYQRVLSAGDGEMQFDAERHRLVAAIEDYTKSLKELSFPTIISSIRADFVSAAATAAITYSASFGNVSASLLAAGVAGIKLTVETEDLRFSSGDEKHPFQYVSRYGRELKWT